VARMGEGLHRKEARALGSDRADPRRYARGIKIGTTSSVKKRINLRVGRCGIVLPQSWMSSGGRVVSSDWNGAS
jgi:hypothetical protein